MRAGTAVQEAGLLYDYELALGKDKKQTPTSVFSSSMMNKKWWLEEQFNIHFIRF